MLWTIEGECQIDTNAGDFVEYTWPLTKPDQQERKITVRIARTAFDTDTLIPPDTTNAQDTFGKSAIQGYLADEDPPRMIICNSAGCSAEAHS